MVSTREHLRANCLGSQPNCKSKNAYFVALPAREIMVTFRCTLFSVSKISCQLTNSGRGEHCLENFEKPHLLTHPSLSGTWRNRGRCSVDDENCLADIQPKQFAPDSWGRSLADYLPSEGTSRVRISCCDRLRWNRPI